MNLIYEKSQAFSDPWRRSKQLSYNEEASRRLLSNHDILIPFAPSSKIKSSLTVFHHEDAIFGAVTIRNAPAMMPPRAR